MKKLIALAMVASLSACAGTQHITDPGPPPKKEVITKEVPVPVLCKIVVTRPAIDIDSAKPDAPLEQQNATLRGTIAQQAVFINDLVAAVIGCGGQVK
jgi:hypothetical protein